MLKVTYDHPHLPKGMEVSVEGLGLVINGEEVEVNSSPEEFENITGKPLDQMRFLTVGNKTEGEYIDPQDKLLEENPDRVGMYSDETTEDEGTVEVQGGETT